MAHKVTFTVPDIEVKHSDIEFVVMQNASKLGTLKVSKGCVEWLNSDKTYGYKMTWAKFARLMEKLERNKTPLKRETLLAERRAKDAIFGDVTMQI